MAGGIFQRIFPASSRLRFDGGKDNKFEKALIPDNESPDCANVIFNNGAVETRGGTAKFNTTAVGSFVGDGLYTRTGNDGVETMCAWWNGTFYTAAGTTFTTVPSGQSVFTAGTRVGAAMQENYLFMGNGGSIPYKWDGTYFTRHGIYSPTGTVSAASVGAGGLTGDYRYKVSYVNTALVESDVGTATATFTAAAAQIGVSSIPVGATSFGVNARKLYRTVAGGSTYKLVTTISDNTTTTYTDTTADGSLGADAPTDQGVPPLYNAVVFHQSRLFMTDPSNLNLIKYSELANPYVVKTTNFIRIGDKTADNVRGLAVYNDSLLVFCDRSVAIIYMESTDPTTWRMQVSRSPYGSKSPYGYFAYNNKVGFPAMEGSKFVGFAAIAGSTVDTSQTQLTVSTAGADRISDRIEPDMFEQVLTAVPKVSAITFQNKAYISMQLGSTSTENNRVYVFDYSIDNLSKNQEAAWVPWTGLKPAQFAVYGGTLHYQAADAVGRVYKMNQSTYSDDGAAINSYFWTKELSGLKGDESDTKDFRAVNLLYELAGNYFMNVTYRGDGDDGSGTSVQVDLNPGSSLWGTMVWGVGLWNAGRSTFEKKIFLAGLRGRRIQFKFSNQNTVNQKFKVVGLSFVYNKRGRR